MDFGGPCVAMRTERRRKGDPRPPGSPKQCAVRRAHAWYAGPTCKNCYESQVREEGGGRSSHLVALDGRAEDHGGVCGRAKERAQIDGTQEGRWSRKIGQLVSAISRESRCHSKFLRGAGAPRCFQKHSVYPY